LSIVYIFGVHFISFGQAQYVTVNICTLNIDWRLYV